MLLGRKQDLIMGYAMVPVVSLEATVIQIDPSEAEIGRNRGVGVGVVGDISAVSQQLADEAAKHSWSDLPWFKKLQLARSVQEELLIRWEKAMIECTRCRCLKRADAILDPTIS